MKSMVLLLVFLAPGVVPYARSESPYVRRTGQITLKASVEKVFPLFGPVEEAKWAPGWEPSIKHGGNSELGTVFTTGSPAHPATWVVTGYSANAHDIEYTVVFAEDRVVQVAIRCESVDPGTTRCSISYALTALTDVGRSNVEAYTQEKHDARIAHWQTAINHYLNTGRRIEGHE